MNMMLKSCKYCGKEILLKRISSAHVCSGDDCKKKHNNWKHKKRNGEINSIVKNAGWSSGSQLMTAIKYGVVDCPVNPATVK